MAVTKASNAGAAFHTGLGSVTSKLAVPLQTFGGSVAGFFVFRFHRKYKYVDAQETTTDVSGAETVDLSLPQVLRGHAASDWCFLH